MIEENYGQKPAVRLYALLASCAPWAVVFRRGPSSQVQLYKWNLETDELIAGQWFKGRIYERRCGLSPSGDKLIYFAANQKPPYRTWTAVSKPPYLTAILLWPNGSTWGGGGLFEEENHILLNQENILADGYTLPKGVVVSPLMVRIGEKREKNKEEGKSLQIVCSGTKEGFGIKTVGMLQSGWQLLQSGTNVSSNPEIMAKEFSLGRRKFTLQVWSIQGKSGPNDPWDKCEYLLSGTEPASDLNLGAADWADIDKNGDLLFARGGDLYRLRPMPGESAPYQIDKAIILHQFGAAKFSAYPAPESATSW